MFNIVYIITIASSEYTLREAMVVRNYYLGFLLMMISYVGLFKPSKLLCIINNSCLIGLLLFLSFGKYNNKRYELLGKFYYLPEIIATVVFAFFSYRIKFSI